MIYSVDRIEENIAVLQSDDGEMLHLPLDTLPTNTQETDLLSLQEDGTFLLEPELKAERQQQLWERLQRLTGDSE